MRKMAKMAKQISTDNLARLLTSTALRPYSISNDANDEQKWIILCSLCKSLNYDIPNDVLVKSNTTGALFNFPALAALNETMLTQFFKTPDNLYTSIEEIIFNGFKKYIDSEYFKLKYDCD